MIITMLHNEQAHEKSRLDNNSRKVVLFGFLKGFLKIVSYGNSFSYGKQSLTCVHAFLGFWLVGYLPFFVCIYLMFGWLFWCCCFFCFVLF